MLFKKFDNILSFLIEILYYKKVLITYDWPII